MYTLFVISLQYFSNTSSITTSAAFANLMDAFPTLPIMKKINYLGETNRVPLDLKSTINLPQTDFPMKANLPQNEPKMLAKWEKPEVYDRIRAGPQGLA